MKRTTFISMIMCVSLIMWSCKGGTNVKPAHAEGDSAVVENPLNVGMPQVEKFVRVVTDEGTKVYRDADVKSTWRVTWWEELESDMAIIVDKWADEEVPEGFHSEDTPAFAGDVLAVLGEEGDFYKVSIRNLRCEMEYGFVKKADVADETPEKVTVEDLEKMAEEFDWIHVRIMKEGKYKGLVLQTNVDQLKGESFQVGVMLDGCVAFPEQNTELIDYSSQVNELTFMNGKQEVDQPLLYFKYPKSMAYWSEYNYSEGLKLDLLTDEQIDKIMQDMLKRKSEFVEYNFLIPMTEGGFRSYWLRSK